MTLLTSIPTKTGTEAETKAQHPEVSPGVLAP